VWIVGHGAFKPADRLHECRNRTASISDASHGTSCDGSSKLPWCGVEYPLSQRWIYGRSGSSGTWKAVWSSAGHRDVVREIPQHNRLVSGAFDRPWASSLARRDAGSVPTRYLIDAPLPNCNYGVDAVWETPQAHINRKPSPRSFFCVVATSPHNPYERRRSVE
jgi:hypothetical protein